MARLSLLDVFSEVPSWGVESNREIVREEVIYSSWSQRPLRFQKGGGNLEEREGPPEVGLGEEKPK